MMDCGGAKGGDIRDDEKRQRVGAETSSSWERESWKLPLEPKE